MQCEICQKRNANVHKSSKIHVGGKVTHGGPQHLCEVCAGLKSEAQYEEQEANQRQQRAIEQQQRREETLAIHSRIQNEFFGPRRAALKASQFFTRGCAVDPHWKLVLTAVGSRLPDVDALGLLLDPPPPAGNHIVVHVGDFEVHLIRWVEDPEQLTRHVFEVFPGAAGASLNLDARQLTVAAERTLFEDQYRSATYCSLAAILLGAGNPLDQRFHFHRRTANS